MAEPFLGEIRMFASNFAPSGWALCNGQVLSIAQNTALFSLLGTFYGGNGTSTFALPDLRSRVAVHAGEGSGLSNYVLGQSGGAEGVTLTSAQMPQHGHSVNCDSAHTSHGSAGFGQSTGATPAGNYLGLASSSAEGVYSSGPPNTVMNAAMIVAAGGNQAHPNIQPYLCVNFIIALEGIFPSRN
jgi:microcystin-dependent protein